MNGEQLAELVEYVVDVVTALDLDPIGRVEILEMADGSRRLGALVTTFDPVNELEQVHRITTPAPADAPAWAGALMHWRVEVRVGDKWLELERRYDEPGGDT